MKNFSYIVAFVVLAIPALAESPIKYINLSSTEPDKLYIGIVNKLKFEDASIHSIQIDGMTYYPKDGYFNINISKVGKFQADIYSGDKKVQTIEFLSRRVPDPVINLGILQSHKITKVDFLANAELKILLPDCGLKQGFEIVSYEVTIIPPKGDILEVPSSTPQMPKLALDRIVEMTPNTTILFENVKIKGPDGSVRKIQGLSYQLI